MFKKAFFHGIAASVLAAIAAIIYNHIYVFATETDYSSIINYGSMIGFSFAVCLLATFIYAGLVKWLGKEGEIIFSFVFSIISFACVMIPFAITLPLTIKMPEFFPGLTVPMVFFPAMAWYTVRPLFTLSN